MIDIRLLREDPEFFKKASEAKGVDIDVDKILALDKERRELLLAVEDLRGERNQISEKLKSGKDDALIQQATKLKEKLGKIEAKLASTEEDLTGLLLMMPNPPAKDVPVGKDESENQVIRHWGEKPSFDFEPKDHLEIGESLGIIDVERATKVSGSRFGYLKAAAVLLEFALVQFAFKTLTNEKVLKTLADKVEAGYNPKPFVPIIPPVMIKPDVFRKMARLDPSVEEERYYLPKDDLYLVGSAEHTLGPMHMDEILLEADLPLRYVGFSTSFRREAGTYGKDTRGILRVHQFDKVEMESFTLPENSTKEQNFIVSIQEYFMQQLEIPYQVVMICTGDMGGPDSRQIDIESWMPSQGNYRETHTSDLMTDYQARRLNTRVKRGEKTQFVHMNDATAFAGRTIIAILENYQQKDGTVKVPEVLVPYAGLEKIG